MSMRKNVLLADRDESVRKMVGRVLESAGYSVTQAGTPAEAVAGLREARPDLVVWDLEMPPAADPQRLEFTGPSEQPVPVVGTTAWPNQEEKAVRKGITTLLEKPLDLALLLQTIQHLLATRDQHGDRPLAAAT